MYCTRDKHARTAVPSLFSGLHFPFFPSPSPTQSLTGLFISDPLAVRTVHNCTVYRVCTPVGNGSRSVDATVIIIHHHHYYHHHHQRKLVGVLEEAPQQQTAAVGAVPETPGVGAINDFGDHGVLRWSREKQWWLDRKK